MQIIPIPTCPRPVSKGSQGFPRLFPFPIATIPPSREPSQID